MYKWRTTINAVAATAAVGSTADDIACINRMCEPLRVCVCGERSG